jgi:hypothetical protein
MTGLRLESRFERATERRLRSGEIAATEMEFAKLVGGLTYLARHVEPQEVLASMFCFRLGLRPSALHPEHLSAVDAAISPPAPRKGRSLAPLLEASSPFAGATQL